MNIRQPIMRPGGPVRSPPSRSQDAAGDLGLALIVLYRDLVDGWQHQYSAVHERHRPPM
jgi:hypothetical protein